MRIDLSRAVRTKRTGAVWLDERDQSRPFLPFPLAPIREEGARSARLPHGSIASANGDLDQSGASVVLPSRFTRLGSPCCCRKSSPKLYRTGFSARRGAVEDPHARAVGQAAEPAPSPSPVGSDGGRRRRTAHSRLRARHRPACPSGTGTGPREPDASGEVGRGARRQRTGDPCGAGVGARPVARPSGRGPRPFSRRGHGGGKVRARRLDHDERPRRADRAQHLCAARRDAADARRAGTRPAGLRHRQELRCRT